MVEYLSLHGPEHSLPSLVRLISLDDLANDRMPDDVGVSEMDKRDIVDAAENVLDIREPRSLPRKVALARIARHDEFGIESQSRQEHLHLLGRRILSLVKDDEGVV